MKLRDIPSIAFCLGWCGALGWAVYTLASLPPALPYVEHRPVCAAHQWRGEVPPLQVSLYKKLRWRCVVCGETRDTLPLDTALPTR